MVTSSPVFVFADVVQLFDAGLGLIQHKLFWLLVQLEGLHPALGLVCHGGVSQSA